MCFPLLISLHENSCDTSRGTEKYMDEAHLQTILAALSSDSLVASYVVFFLLLILCGSWMLVSSQFFCTAVLSFLLHTYTLFFLSAHDYSKVCTKTIAEQSMSKLVMLRKRKQSLAVQC
jgi:hypothetical protein